MKSRAELEKEALERIKMIEEHYNKPIAELIDYLHNQEGLSFEGMRKKFKQELNLSITVNRLKKIAKQNNIPYLTQGEWRKKRREDIEKVFNRPLEELLRILHHEKRLNCYRIAKLITRVMQMKGFDYKYDDRFVVLQMKRYGIKRWKTNMSEFTAQRNKKWYQNPEYREKMLKQLKEMSEKGKEKRLVGAQKWWSDPENRKKMAEKTKKQWEDEEFRKTVIEKRKKFLQEWFKDPEARKIMSEYAKKLWEDEEFRNKKSELNRKLWEDEEFKQKMIQITKERWKNSEYRKKMSEMTSERFKKLWKDEEYRKIMAEKFFRQREKQTVPELIIQQILDELEVHYHYNNPLVLSDRFVVPDFLLKNKKVIEVQGTYWHADPRFYDKKDLNDIQKSNLKNDQEKYKVYKENGYDVLYVWEYDIENHPEKVRKQIKEFLKK